jgi:hypothetical protein
MGHTVPAKKDQPVAISTQPMGLRGRRTASTAPNRVWQEQAKTKRVVGTREGNDDPRQQERGYKDGAGT